MVENESNFSERFEKLRAGRPYQEISDEIFQRFNVRISPQAMHKWVKVNGRISEDNARIVAQYFDVSPGWLIFGEGQPQRHRFLHILENMSAENAQQSLDFIEYQLQKSERSIAAEKLPSYIKMIESIRQDLDKLKGNKG